MGPGRLYQTNRSSPIRSGPDFLVWSVGMGRSRSKKVAEQKSCGGNGCGRKVWGGVGSMVAPRNDCGRNQLN